MLSGFWLLKGVCACVCLGGEGRGGLGREGGGVVGGLSESINK